MFQKCCTFAPSNKKTTIVLLILGYGVMVTQQILVLFFLVRIRVAQLHFAAFPWRKQSVIGLWCNGNTTDSGPVFLGSNPSSPTERCFDLIGTPFLFYIIFSCKSYLLH
jgi:hypothetical protein